VHEFDDSERGETDGVLGLAQMRRQYAVRFYNIGDIGMVALLATIGNLPDVQIMDAERPRVDSTEVVDNRYVAVHFQGQGYPQALSGVIKIALGGQLLTIHHHHLQAGLPCAKCYAPYHTTGFCRIKPTLLEKQRQRYKRVYKGALSAFKVGTAVQYKHSGGDSLAGFLRTLQDEVEADMAKVKEVSLVTMPDTSDDGQAAAAECAVTPMGTGKQDGASAGTNPDGRAQAQHPRHTMTASASCAEESEGERGKPWYGQRKGKTQYQTAPTTSRLPTWQDGKGTGKQSTQFLEFQQGSRTGTFCRVDCGEL
jgi:hypothetical protein